MLGITPFPLTALSRQRRAVSPTTVAPNRKTAGFILRSRHFDAFTALPDNNSASNLICSNLAPAAAGKIFTTLASTTSVGDFSLKKLKPCTANNAPPQDTAQPERGNDINKFIFRGPLRD